MGLLRTAPYTGNYLLGAGILYFNRIVSGVEQGFMDLGNAPNFEFGVAIENKIHKESRTGMNDVDLVVNVGSSVTGKFSLEEYNPENLRLALLDNSGESYLSQTGGSLIAYSVVVKQEKWVRIGTYRSFTGTVTVTNSAGTTTFVENVDYELNYTLGMIKALHNGSISDSETVKVTGSYNTISYPKVNFTNGNPIEGKLLFVGDTNQGPKMEVELWKVSLVPDGNIGLIMTDFGKINFTVTAYKETSAHPSQPYGQLLFHEATTVIS